MSASRLERPSDNIPEHRAPRALMLNGTVGAGKTTTADAIGELLRDRGLPHAVIDTDLLRRGWPAPENDSFNTALGLRNLAALSKNFLAAGADYLVLAGVLETSEDRARNEDALGIPLTVCRLIPSAALIEDRLRRRHPPGAEREWHLRRAPELHAVLSARSLDDYVLEVNREHPGEIALRVLESIGWIWGRLAQ